MSDRMVKNMKPKTAERSPGSGHIYALLDSIRKVGEMIFSLQELSSYGIAMLSYSVSWCVQI